MKNTSPRSRSAAHTSAGSIWPLTDRGDITKVTFYTEVGDYTGKIKWLLSNRNLRHNLRPKLQLRYVF